jgi:preprotein translocase subunit SecD
MMHPMITRTRVLFLALAVAAGAVWVLEGERIERAAAKFELSRSGGLRLMFDVDLARGLADEADRLAMESEDGGSAPAAGGTAAPPVLSQDQSARVREDILRRLQRSLAQRLRAFTGHTVLPHVERDLVYVDLPLRAAESLRRNAGSAERLRGLFKTARLEFRIVDDDDLGFGSPTSRPPGIELRWERLSSAGETSVPYFTSTDPEALLAFATRRVPEHRAVAIGPVGPRAELYRTFLLKEGVGMTGAHITDARVAFDGKEAKPYVQLIFDDRGARTFGKLTGANVHRRMAILLDGRVQSAPVVEQAIAGGVCAISLGGLKSVNELLDEAKGLALVLRSGALAAPVRLVSSEPLFPGN